MIPLPILGFLFGAGGMLLATLAGWGWLVWVHDPAVREEQQRAIAAAVAQEQAASREAAIAALDTQAALSAALAARTQSTRERVSNAALSTCPAAPAALRAAILRQPGAAGNRPR